MPAVPVPLPAIGQSDAEFVQSDPSRPVEGPRAAAADGAVVSLRTATSRTYRLEDGRLQVRIANRPVNHRDADGVWQKNDATLSDDGSGGGRNRAGAYRLSLPKELGARPVTVAVGGDSVGFTLTGGRGTLTRKGSTGTYPEALAGVDLEYQALDEGVKETLILKTPSVATSYEFATRLSRGLRLSSTADGGLVATDSAGTERLRFAAPSVEDSSGSPAGFSTAATSLALSGPAEAPTVTLSLDRQWLADPARVFPVRLDPSYSSTPSAQTYLNSAAATTNYSATSGLRVGTDSGGRRYTTLARFDTSGIPRDVTVMSAQLNADVASAEANAGGVTIDARPLTRAWTASSATWNTYDGVNAWTTGGGDVGPIAASRVYKAGEASISFDVRSLVTDWVSGAAVNQGVQLSTAATSIAGSSLTLYKDAWSPTLRVDVVERVGEQPYYTYSTKKLTDRSEIKVNVASGNLLIANADMDITAPGLNQTIGRFYNSRRLDLASEALPQGWAQTPGNDELMPLRNDGGGLLHYGPTGNYTVWQQNADGSFGPAPGSGADLKYDSASGVRTLTERRSGVVKTFNNAGKLTSVKDRNGNQLSFGYNTTTNRLSSITNPAGRTTTVTTGCGRANRMTSMTDSSNRTWTYSYDMSCNYLTGYTDPAGGLTRYGYDSAGVLTQILSPAGRRTVITYDGQYRALSVTQVTDTSNNTGPTTRYAYSATGGGNGKTTVTDPNGNITTYFYDAQSRVTKVTDGLGRSRSASYNADHSVTSAVDAMSPAGTSNFGFDGDFRATDSTAPTGVKSTLRYTEPVGAMTSRVGHWQPSGSVDGNGSDTSFTYDGPGNLTKTSTAAPTGAVSVSYTYNAPAGAAATCGGKPGQVCTATDGNGNTTRYSYNSTGDLTGIDNPAPLGDVSSTYDGLGRRVSSTDGKGQVTRYVYDNLDRVTQVRLAGATGCTSTETGNGTCIAYSYDADGNRLSQVDQTGTTSYGYDTLSRQTSKTLPGQAAQTLTYDATGNLTSISDPGGTTSYRYDAANQLISLAEPGGSCTTSPASRCTTFGYNNNGVRTSTTYPTSPATTMSVTPDASGRVKQIRAVTGSTVQSDFSYTYTGSTGGDTALTRSRTDALAGRTTSYGYDTLNRLTSAVEKDGAGTTTGSWSYGYDNAGNRTSATIGTTANTFGYNAANQLISRNGSTSGFGYDANGNETSAVGDSIRTSGSWNNKDQLTSITASGSAVPFAYTGLSQNERTSRAGTSFTTSPTGLATETTSGATTSFVRDPDGTLIALRSGGSSFYYLVDGLGSVVGLVNSSGVKVNSYNYDPYGINRSKNEQVANPFEFTAGYLDDQTGLYKLGIRYYDPTLGRFTQPDPTGQDAHYTYAANNPSSNVDPTGAFTIGVEVEACAGTFPSACVGVSINFLRGTVHATFSGGIGFGVKGSISAVIGGDTPPTYSYFKGCFGVVNVAVYIPLSGGAPQLSLGTCSGAYVSFGQGASQRIV